MNLDPRYRVVSVVELDAINDKLEANKRACAMLWWVVFALVTFVNLGISMWWAILVGALSIFLPAFMVGFRSRNFERRYR